MTQRLAWTLARLDRAGALMCLVAALLFYPLAWWEYTSQPGSGITAGLFPYLVLLSGLVFGAIIGAREMETGTSFWAWTQSITRGVWVRARVLQAVVGTLTVLLLGYGAVLVSARHRPIGTDLDYYSQPFLNSHGAYPIVLGVLLTVFGLFLGYFSRRVVTAVIGAVVVTITLQNAVPALVTRLVPTSVTLASSSQWARQADYFAGHIVHVQDQGNGVAVTFLSNDHFTTVQMFLCAGLLTLGALTIALLHTITMKARPSRA